MQPEMERLELRTCARLAYPASFIGWAAADLSFNAVEPSDPIKRLGGDRRGQRLVEIEELASRVGPTSHFHNPIAIEAIRAGEGTGLEHAG